MSEEIKKTTKPTHGEKAITSASIAVMATGNALLETVKGTGSALSWLYGASKKNGSKTLKAAKKAQGAFLSALDEGVDEEKPALSPEEIQKLEKILQEQKAKAEEQKDI